MTLGPVTVVVPNFNGRAFLEACLDAVAAQTVAVHEVVVVDNASTDGSGLSLATSHPWVRVVRSERNLGFAGGANLGVRTATTPFVAVLNSDATPAPDWLEQLGRAPQGPQVWAWGGVLVEAATGLVESAGDAWSPHGFAYKTARRRDLASLPTEPYLVFAPPGAAPVFRREAFLELGGYAEHFFLYYEDVDLCFRAVLAGWEAWVVPTAHVTHLGSASGVAAHSWFHIGRNSLWTAVRDQPDLHWRGLALRTRDEARRARERGVAGPYLRGRLAGVRGLPAALSQRRSIQAARVATAEQVAARYGTPPSLR